MEFKTLWLGLVLSMGAFAVKTGAGWFYLWSRSPQKQKLKTSGLVFLAYTLVFGLVFLLVSRINLLAHSRFLQPFWQSGPALHWLTAALLSLWGLALLKITPGGCQRSRGWLALLVPCPICLSVILLMAAASLVLYFPDQALLAVTALFGTFMLMALLGGLVVKAAFTSERESLESTLGLAMLIMAVYFMVSALVMPQFAELGKVYRLAAYAALEGSPAEYPSLLLTGGSLAGLLALGYGLTWRKLRRRP